MNTNSEMPNFLYKIERNAGIKEYNINLLDYTIQKIAFEGFDQCDDTENIRFNFKFTDGTLVDKISLHDLYSSTSGKANCNSIFCLDFTGVTRNRDRYFHLETLYNDIDRFNFIQTHEVTIEIKSLEDLKSFKFNKSNRKDVLKEFFEYYQDLLLWALHIPEREKSYTTVHRWYNKITYVKDVYNYQISIVRDISGIYLDFNNCPLHKDIKLVFIFNDPENIVNAGNLIFEGIGGCKLSIEFIIININDNNMRHVLSLFIGKIYELLIGRNFNLKVKTAQGEEYIFGELKDSEKKEMIGGQHKFSTLEKIFFGLIVLLLVVIVVLISKNSDK